ncbi:MAG: PqqD family protein [Candidatus Brocadiia bacterium]
MALRRRKKALTREQSLNSVPLRNEAIDVERTDAGHVRVVIPRRQTWWVSLLARVFYVPKARRITLDEVGSFVWDLCDGKHTVRQIIQALCQRYKLHRKEAEVSVVSYLRTLAKKHLVGVAVFPAKEQRGAEGSPSQP